MTLWCLAALVIVAASAMQAVTGFGFSLTALPVLTLIYGTRDGIVLNLLLSTATNLWVSWRTRADSVPELARPLTIGAVIGVVPGVVAYYLVSTQLLRLGIGVMLVGAVLLRLTGTRLAIPLSRKASVTAGSLSGFLQGSIGLGGPPVSLYLSGAGLNKAAYRATIAVFFVLPNAINLPAHLFGLSRHGWTVVGLAATVAVFIPLGAMAGQYAFSRMHQAGFERVVLAVIVFAAVTAVYQGVTAAGGAVHI